MTATQTSGLSVSETFKATVVASAPVVQPDAEPRRGRRTKAVSLSVAAAFTDPQGERLTYTIGELPSGLSFNAKTLTISGTPLKPTTSAITVTAKDQSGLSASGHLP